MAKLGALSMDPTLVRDILVLATLAAFPAWVAFRPDRARR